MRRCYLSAIIVIIISFFVLDGLYLNYLGKNIWRKQIKKIQGYDVSFRYSGAVFAYIVMTISVLLLSVKNVRLNHLYKDSLYYGGLVGLAMYGVFNGTNIAIFQNYKWSTGIMDTVWGIFLCSVTTYLASYASYHWIIIK